MVNRRSARTIGGLVALASALGGAPAAADPGVISEYPTPVETTPYDLATGPDGNIWFVDSGGHEGGGPYVGRMSTTGAISASQLVELPHDLTTAIIAGPDGNMWVAQGSHYDKVPIGVTSSGQIQSREYGAGLKQGGYGSIAVGPDNRLWMGLEEELGAATTAMELDTYPTSSLSTIAGVIAGPGGEMWFGAGNKIDRISTAGTMGPGDEFSLPEGASGINGTALGPDGNVWFTVSSPAAVGKITPTGSVTLFHTPTTSSLPFGIAAGPDGHMWFTERNGDAVGSIPVAATSASEIVEYPVARENAGLIYITQGPDKRMWFAESNESRLGAITTGVAPEEPGMTPKGSSPTETPKPAPSPAALPSSPTPVGCVAEKLSLLDVFSQGGRTHLLGVAPRAAAGKQVKIFSSWNGKLVGRATVSGNLSFSATVALPPRRLRGSSKAAYLVKLGSSKTAPVAFSRRIYTTSITASARTITLSGTVSPPLGKPVAPVLIRAASSCAGVGAGTIVASVTPSPSGAFRASVKLPAALEGAAAVYFRTETKVRRRVASKRTVPAVGLVRGIKLTS